MLVALLLHCFVAAALGLKGSQSLQLGEALQIHDSDEG
jgi:hypothetical protein